jgi:regulator of replication initiation timing
LSAFCAATAGAPSDEARKLSTEVHYLAVHNQLINLENQGLRDSLDSQKKNRTKKKILDVQQRMEYWSGAVLCSSSKVREAQFRDRVKTREDEEEKLRKHTAKELCESNKLLKQKQAEERRVAAAKRKEEREKEKVKRAEKAAACAHEKEAYNTRAALQTAQSGKRKASWISPPKAKRVRRSGVAAEGAVDGQASPVDAPVASPKRARSGRAIKLPTKYN